LTYCKQAGDFDPVPILTSLSASETSATALSHTQYQTRPIAILIPPHYGIEKRFCAKDLDMNALRRRPSKKNWIRFAMKLGLLATDAAVWSSVARMLSDRDDATEIRRESLASNLSPNRGWSHASTLFIGVAIGVGVGMLFAPVSGQEARNTLRETAADVKDKVSNASGWATRGPSTASRRSTGTYAE
jgi:hypothetical protein